MASRRLRLGIALACGAWLALRLLVPRAVHWFVFDDSFYYFAIARNLSCGLGSTFDALHATNGYHPLWMAVCTLPYALGLDDERAVRALLAVATLGLGGAVLVASRVVARRAADARARAAIMGGVLLVAFAFSPLGVSIFANGLESTCTLVFAAALIERLDAHGPALFSDPERGRARLAVSALAAGAFLSRTDAGFLLPWLAGWALVRGGAGRLRRAVELTLLPAVVVVAYLALNRWAFGTATQVSGDLKRVAPNAEGVVTMVALLAAPVALLAVLARRKLELLPRTGELVVATAPILLWSFTLLAYYEGLQRWTQLWYFVAPSLYGAVVMAVVLVDLAARGAAERGARVMSWALAALPVLLLAGGVIDASIPGAFTMLETDIEAARWARANLPEDAIVGSWDAGAIGYYAHRRVINLDGEVNDVGYLRALRAGRTADWAAPQRIDYLMNHTDEDDGEERFRSIAGSFLGDARVARWTLVRSWPFVHRGATNGRAPGRHRMAVWLVRL